jgi:hypothetical protein
MVFATAAYTVWDGMVPGDPAPRVYCINDTASSDYGKCYVEVGLARFVQADTSAYPVGSLPCEKDGTCIRYTNTAWNRAGYNPLFDYGAKQAILTRFTLRTHGSIARYIGNISYLTGVYLVSIVYDFAYSNFFPSIQYEVNQWPLYIPTINVKAYYNPYNIPSGSVVIIEWSGMLLTPRLYVGVYEDNRNNIWYMASGLIVWSYEMSPTAVVPLDYDKDYAPYQELRSAFGYAITGVDQPGWNADDIISVLKELFPDRAWAVFDDRQSILYLYNLTADYIPDWLVEKLVPISMKVLKQPADSSAPKAWLDELNRRNYNTPLSVEV